MLEMTQINYIKDLREKEGLSISEISKRLKIHWNTAKKYADGDVAIKEKTTGKRKRPVMGPYEYLVEAWLEEDLRMPTKQRRTAKTIFNQLSELTDYSGSKRTVRDYVRKIRQKLIDERKEQFVKLTHAPASAQIDFGEFKAIDAKTESIVKYHYLVMTFPYSNVVLTRVTPAENIECFLEAMKSMFEEINGVPITIWFDNLSAAVINILKDGKRDLTKAFKEFEWYYRFKACFCNPNSGHEKGHVEGKVGYVRRNWMSPMPIIESIIEFNNYLQQKLVADRDREHSAKNELISKLWIKDKNALLILPTIPHEIVSTDKKRTNSYNEFKIKNNIYHVPQAYPRQELFLKIYWNTIKIYDEHGEEKLSEQPRKYINHVDKIDWQAELEIFKTKPRAIEHATYLKALPEDIRIYLLPEEFSLRKKRVKTLIKLLENYTITEINKTIATGLKEKRLTFDDLQAMLAHQTSSASHREPVDEAWTPESVRGWQPGLSDYDELCQELIT
jgi:transposase